jgi:hypothetical protein
MIKLAGKENALSLGSWFNVLLETVKMRFRFRAIEETAQFGFIVAKLLMSRAHGLAQCRLECGIEILWQTQRSKL